MWYRDLNNSSCITAQRFATKQAILTFYVFIEQKHNVELHRGCQGETSVSRCQGGFLKDKISPEMILLCLSRLFSLHIRSM